MRVLLTGGSGFIGSHVARLLVGEGHEVHVVVRDGSSLWRISDLVDDLRLVHGDVLRLESINETLCGIRPEICIHAAWYAEPGKYLDAIENVAFASASLALASRLAELGCARFVGVGTCFEYDTSLGRLSETSATRPLSIYAAAKLAVATVLERLPEVTAMSTCWTRLFYQYGPFEDPRRLVPAVTLALLHGEPARTTAGEQVRDFLHVEDVASAIWTAARSVAVGSVNIGSGDPITVREVVEAVADAVGRRDLVAPGAIPYAPNDPMIVYADNAKLRELGWTPQHTLGTGVQATVEWWRNRPAGS